MQQTRSVRSQTRIAPFVPAPRPPSAPELRVRRAARPKEVVVLSAGDHAADLVRLLRRAAGSRVIWRDPSHASGWSLARACRESDATLLVRAWRDEPGRELGVPGLLGLGADAWPRIRRVRSLPGCPSPLGARVDLVIVDRARASWAHTARVALETAWREERPAILCPPPPRSGAARAERMFRRVAQRYPLVETSIAPFQAFGSALLEGERAHAVLAVEAAEGDAAVRLAAASAGWFAGVPSVRLGDGHALFEVAPGPEPSWLAHSAASDAALVLVAAHLLEHLGESDAAARLEHALIAELAEREGRAEGVWPELWSHPPRALMRALAARV